jgi:hypothetical protein
MSLCTCLAICCAVLHTAAGDAHASSTDKEKPATEKAGAVPPAPQKQTSEVPPRPGEPPGLPDEFVDDEEDYLVRYEDGQLTVDVLDMPLEDLLMEVGHQSGARVRVEGLEKRTVTDAFTRLSLDAALRRLVRGKNFSLVYAEKRDKTGKAVGTRLKELTVYGGRGSVRTYQPPPPGAGATRPTAAGPSARASAPARNPRKKKDEQAARKPQPVDPEVERAEKPVPVERAEPEQPADVEPAEFANPVTAAILGRRPARPVEPAPVEDVSPEQDEFLPLNEEVPEFEDELAPVPEEFEGEPAVEDEWFPEFEGEDPGAVDDGMYEEAGYD